MFKKKLLSAFICASTVSIAGHSNISFAQDDAVTEEEILIVSGYRSSIRAAIDIKREASNIVDSLSSEDIGELPDLSIAESLERITGLAADRDRGNSSQISIRGLGPQLGLTIVNGREMTTAAPDRDVRFDQFPSELIDGADVYKSPIASIIEGGVSGTINLKTVRPLDKDKRIAKINVKGIYSELESELDGADGFGTRISGAYIDQFMNDTFGIAIGYAYRDQGTATQRYINGGSDDNKDFDGDGNGDFAPGGIVYRLTDGQDERHGVYFDLQWRPNDSLDINIDGIYTDREGLDQRSFLQFFGLRSGAANIDSATITSDGSVVAASETNIGANNQSIQGQYLQQNDTSFLIGGNVAWNNGKWTVIGDLAFSETERERTNILTTFRNLTGGVEVDWENNGDISTNVPITDSTNYWPWRLDYFRDPRKDELTEFSLDFERELGNGFFNNVQFGLRWIDRTKENTRDRDRNQLARNTSGTDASFARDFPYASYLTDLGQVPEEWFTFDVMEVVDAFWGGAPSDGLDVNDQQASFEVSEERTSLYIQTDFSSSMGSVDYSGNIGIRYIETEVDSSSVRGDFTVETDSETGEPTLVFGSDVVDYAVQHSYTNVLPSLNINFELQNDLFLRTALAKVIARAPIDSLSANRSFSANAEDPSRGRGSGGNPTLDPFKATQADLSLEWYFSEESLLALALFYKDIDTFISTDFRTEVINDVAFDVTQPVNGQGGEISGLEFTLQTPFYGLSKPFDNFGINANLTLTDSSAEVEINDNYSVDLPGFSDTVANLALYYDNGKFNSRLAYRYRSEFYRPAFGINRDAEFLDFSMAYKISNALKVNFQVLNLTDEPIDIVRVVNDVNATGVSDNRRAFVEYSGVKYFLGVSYTF